MKTDPNTINREEFEALRAEVAELKDLVKSLVQAQVKPAPKAAPAKPKVEGVSEDEVYLIAAVIAAYFGQRARIRSIRYVPPEVDGWRLQGRVLIQGSHNLKLR